MIMWVYTKQVARCPFSEKQDVQIMAAAWRQVFIL